MQFIWFDGSNKVCAIERMALNPQLRENVFVMDQDMIYGVSR